MELRKLAEHFEKVEEELDKAICETARLTSQIDFLQERLNESDRTVSEKDKELKVQQAEIEGLKTRVSQANQEVLSAFQDWTKGPNGRENSYVWCDRWQR